MESGVKERLKTFIKTLRISEREFCRRCGLGSAYIQSIKQSIAPDKLNAISIQFPDLNPLWLLLGQGEMLLSENKTTVEPASPSGSPSSEFWAKLLEDTNNEKFRLLSIIESQQRTIENLTELNKKANAQPEGHVKCADVG